MSRRGDDLPDLVGELAETTEQLRDELDGGPRLRPPTPGELVRFTSDVTIPAIILVLETNVRALRLLQRTLRFAEGRSESVDRPGDGARERAADLGRETLDRFDSALADLQDALSGRPSDDDARELLEEARNLRTEIEHRLDAAPGQTGEPADEPTETVPIDVDSELQSIKDSMDDDGQDDDDGEA